MRQVSNSYLKILRNTVDVTQTELCGKIIVKSVLNALICPVM